MITTSAWSDQLSPDEVVAVRRIASAAEAADGVAPLSEQTLLRLADRRGHAAD